MRPVCLDHGVQLLDVALLDQAQVASIADCER
jgi:hypothetical protein